MNDADVSSPAADASAPGHSEPVSGQVHVYTGDGKGKTTAAFGLVLRAVGHDMRVYVGQFMKGQPYGEIQALAHHPLVTIVQYGTPGYIRREDVGQGDRQRATDGLALARDAIVSGGFDLVVLDEIATAVWFGLLSVDDVLALIAAKPPAMELVLTGRRAPQAVLDRAGLVTEMREVKHYYRDGVLARPGVEY